LIYQWSFNPLLQENEVWVRPRESTEITVEILDTLTNCTASASVRLLVDRRPRVYIPNAFSPNGDGINDIFFPFGGTDVEDIRDFRIFGRYGNLVYEAGTTFRPNNPNLGWDGRVNGEAAEIGLYVYSAMVRFYDGREEVVKGEVMLMR